MPWRNPNLWPEWAPLAAFVSFFGGAVRWYENVQLGGKFHLMSFLADMLISCVIGYAVFWLAVDFEQHLSVCACLAGVAGNVGSRCFDIARVFFGRRYGIPPDVVNPDDSRRNEDRP